MMEFIRLNQAIKPFRIGKGKEITPLPTTLWMNTLSGTLFGIRKSLLNTFIWYGEYSIVVYQ
jgi:hypothetical protein